MAEPRVIPGFYYDVEKGKYFKITKTHSAPPSQAKYTLQNVRKEQKKSTAEKQARKQQEKREAETIVRPHSRNRWGLQMASLDREIGGRRKTYYTHGIWPDACVAGMEKMKTVCTDLCIAYNDPDIDGPYVNQQFTPKNCSTIWGAAAPTVPFAPNSIPQSGTESLAVAASSSLLLFERSPTGEWNSSTALQRDTDILALDWLSPTTIILGERSGKILLYDTRSKGHSHILTNPFPISKLKRADDPTRLICAGVQDSLFLYDIRSRDTFSQHAQGHYSDKFFNDQYPGFHRRQKRKKMKHTAAANWSQPIVSFQYANPDDLYLDIAVQPDLGLIAAAQDVNSSAAIKIYNMWTGKLLKEIPQQSPVKVHIRCLRFMQDSNDDPELWSSWGGSVVKMSLG
ncbi:uncharacterized protein N0V89_010031 [Didymosphaeria variabile]|uniref:WD40 repeat-like protein n=1 Tax=Didymosphaeria variabile TaxID=1932322 RepID=A0A9W8XGR6_9PLEO|nr:uncharacterized protein N0V89_010031 [Didymosphaeria variabile]KAJ4348653.1 hypothetical protein N0V89_010031 [Didymosphaeria variabile]